MGCKIVHIADDGLQHCPDFIVHASNPQLCSHFYLKPFLIKMADTEVPEDLMGLLNDVIGMAEDAHLEQGLRAAAHAVSNVTILNL